MDNVVPFSSMDSGRLSSGKDSEKVRADADRDRADKLRAARDRKEEVFSQTDQVRAARNLYELLESFERQGFVRKRDVAIQAGLGGGEADSTKRLDTYTLPKDASEVRKGRLAKKPHKYFTLADAVADSAQPPQSRDTVLCRIFEGCSFGEDTQTNIIWEGDRWERLAGLMEEMTEAIVRKMRLRDYWRDVLSVRGQFDIISGDFYPANQKLDGYCLPLAGAYVECSETPPIPSVPFARTLVAEPRSATLSFRGGPDERVWLLFWRQTRLAIGPVRSIEGIGPLLESRIYLEARTQSQEPITFDFPYVATYSIPEDGFLISRATLPSGETVPVQFTSEIVCPDIPDGRDELNEFGWDELNARSLELACSPGKYDGPYAKTCCYVDEWPAASQNLVPAPFWFRESAFYLYNAVLNGSFEEQLISACQTMAIKLAEHKKRSVETAQDAEAAARRRWARMNSDTGGRKEP